MTDAERFLERLEGKPTRVRVDHVHHRYLIICDCERVISLPLDGASSKRCECGYEWTFDGEKLSLTVVLDQSGGAG